MNCNRDVKRGTTLDTRQAREGRGESETRGHNPDAPSRPGAGAPGPSENVERCVARRLGLQSLY